MTKHLSAVARDFVLSGVFAELASICWCRSVRAMDVVYTGNVHNKSLIHSGTEALSKSSTDWGNLQGQETNGFNEAFVEFLSCWDLNATTVESKTAIEIKNSCQTNAKYNIRQITKTLTNTKYQTANKCQTDDPSPECHLKYTEKELIPANLIALQKHSRSRKLHRE